jgi:N-acetylglucosaminyldiphosphoundecaprenol N-acetyl-beta-D-mannosaminyltransferase
VSERRRISLMGMPIDVVSEPEVVGTIVGALDAGRGGTVITPHLEILRRYCTDPSVRRHFDTADLIVADGQPLVWASRIIGTPLPERVAGSDLVWSLAAECALRGRSVYLLGGAPGVCEAAKERLRSVYPGLRVAGCHSPPMGLDPRDPEAIRAIRARLRAAQPDVVFVALGFPKQERVIAQLRGDLPESWFLGIGVSMSFVAGHVARAPHWAIALGIEWLHRLLQEPRRLFRRYLIDGLPFAARLFAHSARRRIAPRSESVPPARNGVEPPRIVFHHGSLERIRIQEVREILEEAAPALPSVYDHERQQHTARPPLPARPERLG